MTIFRHFTCAKEVLNTHKKAELLMDNRNVNTKLHLWLETCKLKFIASHLIIYLYKCFGL